MKVGQELLAKTFEGEGKDGGQGMGKALKELEV
jgi:hypothetical protein